MFKPKRRWLWLFVFQITVISFLTALSVVLLLAGPDAAEWIYTLAMWGIIPLAGALTAFFLVLKGEAAFTVFWLPALCQTGVHWAMIGMPPSTVGMPILTFLLSVIGAAAGEELFRRGKGGVKPNRNDKNRRRVK